MNIIDTAQDAHDLDIPAGINNALKRIVPLLKFADEKISAMDCKKLVESLPAPQPPHSGSSGHDDGLDIYLTEMIRGADGLSEAPTSMSPSRCDDLLLAGVCESFHAKRAEIWSRGRLGRIQEVSAAALSSEFHISREAAQFVSIALENDGLVKQSINDEASEAIWKPSADDFALRFLIETLAASRLADKPNYDMSALKVVHEQYRLCAAQDGKTQRLKLANLDLKLHTTIVSDSGLGLAAGCVRSAMQRISVEAPRRAGRDEEIVAEHAAIIDAIESKEIERIGAAYRTHFYGFAQQFGAPSCFQLPGSFNDMLRVSQAMTLMSVAEDLTQLFRNLRHNSLFVFLSHNVVPLEFQQDAWAENVALGELIASAVANGATLLYLRQSRDEGNITLADEMSLPSNDELNREFKVFQRRIAEHAHLKLALVEERVIQIPCNLMDAPFLPDFSVGLFRTLGECNTLTIRESDGGGTSSRVRVVPVGGASAAGLSLFVESRLRSLLTNNDNEKLRAILRKFWPIGLTIEK